MKFDDKQPKCYLPRFIRKKAKLRHLLLLYVSAFPCLFTEIKLNCSDSQSHKTELLPFSIPHMETSTQQ